MASLMQPSRVDWDVVDEELDRVPDEFKDPRFDSLRHVLDILSAVDAEAALQELKAQQERVEQMVDDVVQGYHGGFNKSTHNYSQILHLFTMAKDQVHKLRSQLEDAQRRLTSQSHTLEAQWKRSTQLGETVRLLRDINSCTDIPQRVQQLQQAKKWGEAVALLLEGCTKLARSEYAGIGALKELKRELGSRRGALLRALVAEMEAAVFEGLEEGRLREPAEQQSELYRLASAGSDMPRLASGASSTWGGAWQQPQSPSIRSSSEDRRPGTPQAPGPGAPGEGHQMGREAEERCRELVAAAARIGGLAEAQAALRRHLPTQVSRVILRAMQHAKPLHGLRQAAAGSNGRGMSLEPATVQAAVWLLDCVFSSCSQALQRLVRLLKLVAAAKPPPPSAGLELLLASGAAAGQAAGAAGPPASGLPYARREADHAWECMQKELQALLSDLLQPGAAADIASFQPGADSTKLTFSFDVQVQGVSARALLQRESSLPRWEGGDQQQLLRAALRGFAGSTYLTPHVYLPTKQFVEFMQRSLSDLDKEAEAASSAWFGGGGGDRSEARHSLRAWLAGFVDSVFLPTLSLDCRSQFATVLEDPEGMRTRGKPQGALAGAAVAGAAGGQALLPAASAAEVSVQQLLGWALLMPPFASRLVGVLEEVVGKVLEAFQARTGELLAGSAAKALAEDASLALQMAGEPAAPQAGEAAAFYVQRAGESIDHFVASILQTGWGSGGEAAEIAVLQRVLKERPVAASALLTAGGSSRVTHLAAAADSLEHLAGVIEGCISQAVAELPFSPQRSVQTPRLRQPSAAVAAEGSPPLLPPHVKSAGLPLEGLDHLVDRYRSLAGQSLRALRLEMLLLVVHHLSHLAQARFVCDAAEAQDVDECIGALQRSCARADEAASPFLPPAKRAYVFGGTAAAAARFVMWLLPELKAMNHAGLARICRMLAVLQPFLAALGSAGGLFRPEDARHLERARAYYAHLTYSAPALLSAAAARPTRFTPKEYMALLEVDFQGREVQDAHRAEMARVVLAAAKKSAKQSFSRP